MQEKSLIVAGSEGLIGSCVVDKLKYDYNVICCDPKKENNINLQCENTLKRLFYLNNIVGYVNCAYPKGFVDHIMFFMETTEKIAKMFFEKNTCGSIVNMASIYGLVGPDDRIYDNTDMEMPSWYAAVKGAIISHSRCMAVRYAEDNIRINCIAAGGVYDGQVSSFVEAYCNRVPMERMATPEDIADVVIFLLSDKSKYITGQCIPVDGGLTAW